MVCKKCGIDKPLSEFYQSRGYYKKECKECTKKAVSINYQKNLEKYRAYSKKYNKAHRDIRVRKDEEYREKVQQLKTSCLKCGDTRLYLIDFHHIDPEEKLFNINRKTSKGDFSVIQREAEKCVSLCRNCHQEFHHFYGLRPKHPKQSLEEYLGRKL